MRMMMMMGGGGGGNMDGRSSDEHHVVVGRMEMGPEGLRLLEDNGNRILYGEKVMVVEKAEDEEEEEEEEEEEDDGDGHVHSNKLANRVYTLQQEQLPGENGAEEHQGGGVAVTGVYGVGVMGNGGGVGGVQQQLHHSYHHHDELVVEPKLGELGNSMLRVGGDSKSERPAASEGDVVGTTQSPRTAKSSRGRSSRDPAIEWSESATTVLLQAFGEKYRALDRGNFTSKIWADIAARVNAYGMSIDGGGIGEGTPKTQEQCRIKVDNLKKRFKVEKEKKRVSGSTTSKWPFFETMEELIGSNPRLMRGGAAGGSSGGDLALYGLENGAAAAQQQQQQQQPLAIRSSLEEAAARIYYLEAPHSGEGDQTSETVPKISPVERGKRKRALKDLERENVNAVVLRALFDGFNIPASIIDAMVQEDMDESTLINSKDITGLIDQVRIKHRLHIKLGPAERIKQAIEEAREKRKHAAL
ncbi:hypothetical protein BDL97_06G089600 [Sphagnum fallax]|nr:hypothetical protein BDL97_06G089600 [Sphagnum fallax]